jgi:hypothetical protein
MFDGTIGTKIDGNRPSRFRADVNVQLDYSRVQFPIWRIEAGAVPISYAT